MTSRSVAQIATASILISTSALPGITTGLSIKDSSSGSPKTHAFIVSGIGCLTEVFPLNSIDIMKPLVDLNESIK